MDGPKLLETRDVALPDIFIEDRLRGVGDAGVSSLMASIEQIGLQDEIQLRRVRLKSPLPDGAKQKLVLMAGGHRLEAVHQLGHETIRAKIWDCTQDHARLIEIDDNLAGADLAPLDLAVFLAERKRVYEDMYPETKRGAKGLAAANSDHTDMMSVRSFASATAEQMGQSERNVYRLISVAQKLDAKTVAALRAAPKPVTLKDLDTLAKEGDPKARAYICKAIAQGKAKNAMDAQRKLRATSNPAYEAQDPHDVQAGKITDAWSRASKAGKHRFVRAFADELRELIADVEREAGDAVEVTPFKRRTGN